VTEFSTRPFAESDIERLHAIRSAAFVDVFQSFRDIMGPDIAASAMLGAEDEQASLLNSFKIATSEKELHVACLGEVVIGFVAISFDERTLVGEIVLLAVDPAHSDHGYGTALNLVALRRMRERGMRVATVGTGGDPSHAAARRSYEKSGFERAIPNLIYYRSLDGFS
jgi:ribosomal protein S18 acetylase RimI-like enzyme